MAAGILGSRIGRAILGMALVMLLPVSAHAQANATEAQKVDKAVRGLGGRPVYTREVKHDRPVVVTDASKAGKTRSAGRTSTRGTATWSSDPVVAKDSKGRFYDKRTGEFMTTKNKRGRDRIADAQDRNAALEGPPQKGVEVWRSGNTGGAGMTGLGFENGERVLVDNDYVDVTLKAARVEGTHAERVYLGRAGADLAASGEVKAIAVGVGAETGRGQLGGDLANVAGSGSADAAVLAEAKGDANLHLSLKKAQANLGGEAFAGAKGEVQGDGEANLLGVGIKVKGSGSASAGIGAEGKAYLKIDWTNMIVKAGGKLGATVGVGLGAGAEVEISVADAVKGIGNALQNAGDWLSDNLGGGGGGYSRFNQPPPPKYKVVGGQTYARCDTHSCIGQPTRYNYMPISGDPPAGWDRENDYLSLSRLSPSGNNVGRFSNTLPSSGGTLRDLSPEETKALRDWLQNGGSTSGGQKR